MPSTTIIPGKADITIKPNEIKQCKLGEELFYLTLEKLSGLNNIAPKSAIIHVDERQISYYSTPGGALYPEDDAPFNISNQLVNIRLELDTAEFTAQQLSKIEMVLSVIAA
ncbi:MAG TPA: hypothetical protein VK783_00710 [Bacteroidia bacterium]|jgi:hypothetical protein|nr:hypothetical protein [Bacteroidia bacterium]